ncbi:hypothetical protein GPECTOR_33g572 [Gonium pectorale]|uniref:Uncharacterized protein n=1 Tax=Gonium pectorale TaxID=33097 RepID=A0A150GEB3_GONPE|nr:hypothetical protein GPECTOR_33g572 [Gonium pectorale]|eukprot:KXZ47690.1 hypothetical protein GPECTOR_33g572 [Gonium pectorale]
MVDKDKYSARARALLSGSLATYLCNGRYNVSTPEGKAQCRADRDNKCFVAVRTLYFRRALCQSRFKDECLNRDQCVWSEVAWYGGKARYDAWRNETEANMGGPPTFGACYAKEEIDAMLDGAGNLREAEYTAWLEEITSSKPASIAKYRGNCPYARSSRARAVYVETCDAANKVALGEGGRVKALNTSSWEDVAACRAAGCVVEAANGLWYESSGYAGDFPDVLYQCKIEESRIWATRLSAWQDEDLFKAYAMCHSYNLQADEKACKGARIL